MIRYLKDRGTYVLFNTNGTLMQPKRFQELIDTGLDELRVSLDAADRETYLKVRGKDYFNRIVRDVGKFIAYQKSVGATTPRVSLWLTGLRETVEQLPDFVRLSAAMGVKEVHLQRLVFDEQGYGMARSESSLFESTQAEEQAAIEAAQAIGATMGGRGPRLVHLSAAVVADVFHRPWPGAALLHRALLGPRLQQLHAGRRHPEQPAGDLEQPGL
jgi:MoaA/NifB/PqqE/SkfB family radical SAM enzyme